MLTRTRGGGGIGGSVVDPSTLLDGNGAIDLANKYTGAVETAFKEAVSRDLSLGVINKRQASLVNAMQHPDQWLNDRAVLMDSIKDRLAKAYAEQSAKYYAAGFSKEESMRKASEYCNILYEKELQDLELTHPGSSTVFAAAAFSMNNLRTGAALANGAAETEKDIYKRIRREKKAKKKSKKAPKVSS